MATEDADEKESRAVAVVVVDSDFAGDAVGPVVEQRHADDGASGVGAEAVVVVDKEVAAEAAVALKPPLPLLLLPLLRHEAI